MASDEDLFEALDALVLALRESSARNDEAIRRADVIRRRRSEGAAWTDIVSGGDGPLIVELLSRNMEALTSVGSRLRRLEAKALHDEGLSMERIAELFGVTRQRISELLRPPG